MRKDIASILSLKTEHIEDIFRNLNLEVIKSETNLENSEVVNVTYFFEGKSIVLTPDEIKSSDVEEIIKERV